MGWLLNLGAGLEVYNFDEIILQLTVQVATDRIRIVTSGYR